MTTGVAFGTLGTNRCTGCCDCSSGGARSTGCLGRCREGLDLSELGDEGIVKARLLLLSPIDRSDDGIQVPDRGLESGHSIIKGIEKGQHPQTEDFEKGTCPSNERERA